MNANQCTLLGWVCLIAYYLQTDPNYQLLLSSLGFIFFSISIIKRVSKK